MKLAALSRLYIFLMRWRHRAWHQALAQIRYAICELWTHGEHERPAERLDYLMTRYRRIEANQPRNIQAYEEDSIDSSGNSDV